MATRPLGKGPFSSPKKQGNKYDAAFEHEFGGHGAFDGYLEGSMTKEVFEAYVEHLLAPTLRRGQAVMMDNLSAHKGERVRKLSEGRGCKLLYLPPYSPDLNPIEEAFSKIKRLLRVFGARTKEALVEAIGKALDVVGAGDARGFFTHCVYGGLEQQP